MSNVPFVPPPWLTDLANRFAADPGVEAITVTGSYASGQAAPDSDVDLFAYARADTLPTRKLIASELASERGYVGVGETAFGDADTWRNRDSGVWVDIAWWSCDWADQELDALLDQNRARTGYTTAFWRSIRSGRPIFERTAWHRKLQSRAGAAFPADLTAGIIALNRPLLGGHPFSFRHQLESALERGDAVSLNHRIGAWLASYFDIVFAINGVLHPGEKRLVEVAEHECRRLPEEMRHDIQELLSTTTPLEVVDRMVARLDNLLVRATPEAD